MKLLILGCLIMSGCGAANSGSTDTSGLSGYSAAVSAGHQLADPTVGMFWTDAVDHVGLNYGIGYTYQVNEYIIFYKVTQDVNTRSNCIRQPNDPCPGPYVTIGLRMLPNGNIESITVDDPTMIQ